LNTRRCPPPASIPLTSPGVSLLTQALYALVFLTRYIDLFLVPPLMSKYLTFFKITYIVSSLYTVYILLRVFPRSRESESQWRLASYLLLLSAVAAPVFQHFFARTSDGLWFVVETLRDFSLILESVAVLPQLTLLAHTAVPTVLNSYYLLALGSYRALYIPNWIQRSTDPSDDFHETVSVIFGVIQTLLYVEFAYIYWRRQKVKLRNGGGVLDQDEFARGIVLGRLVGGGVGKTAVGGNTGGGWRGNAISVSADDFEVAADDDDSDDDGLQLEEEDNAERGLMHGARA